MKVSGFTAQSIQAFVSWQGEDRTARSASRRRRSDPAMASPSAVVQGAVMTPIEADAAQYLEWMEIHNYAAKTIDCRRRYLGYFFAFVAPLGSMKPRT